ncbi:MAG: hypothetical protein LKI24_05360 [Acidipropionibacterium sp.]|nr:hypothetical protein [Acidipropionibacterium sp.]
MAGVSGGAARRRPGVGPDRAEPAVAGLLEHLGRISPSADKQLSYALAAHQSRQLAGDRQGWAKVGVRLR